MHFGGVFPYEKVLVSVYNTLIINDLRKADKGTGKSFTTHNTTGEYLMKTLHCKALSPTLESKTENQRDFSVSKFIGFLKRLKLHRLLRKIKDPRDPAKVKYRHELLILWALSIFFFRRESVNSFYAALEKLSAPQRKTIWYLLGCEEGSPLPHRTVVTDLFSLLDPDEINALLMDLFTWAYKQKIFYNHSHRLLPQGMFHIAIDGVWLHYHKHPHCADGNGKNSCPYCLPRVYNKDTEKEVTHWLHACVNFCMISPGGLQLPLYVHVLKAQQLQGKESASAADHKQECELQAATVVLPLLKKLLPRLAIRILTDSLYANAPFLRLCKELGWDHLITRQTGSLKTIGKQCDEREKSSLQKQWYSKERTIKSPNGGTIVQTIRWFNSIYVDEDLTVHVLRFEETHYDANGKIVKRADGKDKRFKTEWLSSTRITESNCFDLMVAGRMRADQEDLHNTLKNRGFAATHEYAYANPIAWIVWKHIMFIAFWIFELFSLTRAAQEGKGPLLSWHDFAWELFAELTQIPIERLLLAPSLQKERFQFRMGFSWTKDSR